jgi:hypothetical protein
MSPDVSTLVALTGGGQGDDASSFSFFQNIVSKEQGDDTASLCFKSLEGIMPKSLFPRHCRIKQIRN